jgi:uncharacterized protein (TIGR00269 family)
MFSKNDRILVCVSGGKDSLALWDLLLSMGYQADGLYIDLGIEGYSEKSLEKINSFSQKKDLQPIVVGLKDMGLAIPNVAKKSRRKECSVCGLVKRHFFNKVACEGGFDVVATGHNLDDETSRLLGNVLHWRMDYLARQKPILPDHSKKLKKKVQPLFRMSERETAAYAFLNGIDYVFEECPMSRDATSLKYKEVLARLEAEMPGTKAAFYREFLKVQPTLEQSYSSVSAEESPSLECSGCGFPSFIDPCNFCRLKETF